MAPTWGACAVLAASVVAHLTGHHGLGELLLAAGVVAWLAPTLPGQQAVLRSWLNNVPSFNPAHRPAEELHRDRQPDRSAL